MNTELNEDLSREQEVAGSSDRAFGLVFAGAFCVLSFWPLVRGGQIRVWALAVAAGFLAAALLRPALLRPLNQSWFRFGLLLHRVVSPLVLALIFYAVLAPIGLLMRVVGSRPLQLGFDPEAQSYWTPREPAGPAPETMTRQF